MRQPSDVSWKEATRYLVGGVNSPVRAFRQIQTTPLMAVKSRGAELYDAQGRRRIDWVMGWGALILGHQPAVVRAAIRGQIRQGIMMGFTHPAEVQLARLIVEAVPSVEQVRFTVSGSEACMTAVRLARGVTKRPKILLVEGGYHGHGDTLMAGPQLGVPEQLQRDVIVVSWNDLHAFESAVKQWGRAIAGVIIEPVPSNMGVMVPMAGYLERIRTLTAHHGILLIFDEVVTGFRVGWSGAQQAYGIEPDLTTFGKIIGGGLPIGAIGGPRRLMRSLAPEGPVFHGGTFAGHPLSMAAGIATLSYLRQHPPYQRLERRARKLADGLLQLGRKYRIPLHVNRVGSMMTVFFSSRPVTNFQEARRSDRRRFAQWAKGLLGEGILIPPSPFETCFLSTAHTEAHVEHFLRATSRVFARMRA